LPPSLSIPGSATYGADRPANGGTDEPALSASGLRTLAGVYVYIQNSGLPKTLVDLVFLRAPQLNGCAYCIDMHGRDLIKGGVPVEDL
jgi:AhpD family alkylhydroperoxidase